MTTESGPGHDDLIAIPDHLWQYVHEAVDHHLEDACDAAWGEETRNEVIAAVHLWDATIARTLTATQTATVADLTLRWIEPHWPKTTAAVADAQKLLGAARELIELRDRAASLTSRA
jgi:hypothetical protein